MGVRRRWWWRHNGYRFLFIYLFTARWTFPCKKNKIMPSYLPLIYM
jgi:hypothetical protein